MSPNPVGLTLTNDEALVLFEFLSRFLDTNELKIEDQAEQRALWNLQCLLESRLVEILLPNYRELVDQARNRLRDSQ
ncbi:MAG TPA: hypothetical protein VLM40_14315 [Gemmata sp.]|nr:hypothetical protein [Gemmata sp.]